LVVEGPPVYTVQPAETVYAEPSAWESAPEVSVPYLPSVVSLGEPIEESEV
jgi:hypothetical protein